jgi:hypothetical protein
MIQTSVAPNNDHISEQQVEHTNTTNNLTPSQHLGVNEPVVNRKLVNKI